MNRSRNQLRARTTAAFPAIAALMTLMLAPATPVGAVSTDTRIDFGGNKHVFGQNWEDEPSVALDPAHPNILAAGVNDNPDGEACNAGDPTTCPYDETGGAGISFSTDGGSTWTAPIYTGLSARNCLGPEECVPDPSGPISTPPWYDQIGMYTIGDPALEFGPKPDANGHFSWANGSRLYYANIALPFLSNTTFKGQDGIYVSRTDDVAGAIAGKNSAWMAPVLVSRPNAAVTHDKNQLWVDNAASSPFFGNVYECNVAFRGAGKSYYGNGEPIPDPLVFARSTDGGTTWSSTQLSAATNNNQTGGRQACSIRTTSDGVVLVIWIGQSDTVLAKTSVIYEARSYDGGVRFEKPRPIGMTTSIGQIDPIQGTFSIDGVAGARTWTAPTIDTANGAPTGAAATNRIVVAWSDDRNGTNQEHGWLITSTDKGGTFGSPIGFGRIGDRVNQPAVAISPDGANVYVVYNAFLDPWRSTVADPRRMLGVVQQASWGGFSTWTTLHTGTVGDARAATSNTIENEFLGDYNSAWATNSGVFGAWNDARDTAPCPAVYAYRQALLDGSPTSPPAPQQDCPDTFGSASIYGGWYTP